MAGNRKGLDPMEEHFSVLLMSMNPRMKIFKKDESSYLYKNQSVDALAEDFSVCSMPREPRIV